jgi:uracil-DNA glycosylase
MLDYLYIIIVMVKKEEEIEKIRNDLVNFKKSPFYSYRKKNNYIPVVGDGNLDAKIIFIGEAPGKKEAEKGKPFIGASGKLLDKLLLSINLLRNDIYITNIVNDRPPKNRDPKPMEIKLYSPFFDRLLDLIKPKVICTLGRFSMQYLIEKYKSENLGGTIGDLHGKPMKIFVSYGEIMLIPLYHPAFALYNGSMKKILEKDIKEIKRYL